MKLTDNNVNYPASFAGMIGTSALVMTVVGIFQRDLIGIFAAFPFALVAIALAILSFRVDE